jgi:hypothetical protein
VTFSAARSKQIAFAPIPMVLPSVSGFWLPTNDGFPRIRRSGPIVDGDAIYIPIPCPHQGATLSTVTCFLSITQDHTGVPANRPTMSVVRIPFGVGGSVPVVFEDLGGTFGALQSMPDPGSGAAYTASHNVQFFNFNCQGVKAVISNDQYQYFVVLIDEYGLNAVADGSNIYLGFTAGYTNISDMRFAY